MSVIFKCLLFAYFFSLSLANSNDADTHFLSWFRARGGIIDGVSLQEFPNMGRGVLSIKDIQEGSAILTIPYSMIFSSISMSVSKDPLHVKLSEAFSNIDESLAIVGGILLESLRGKDSSFYEYIQVLPKYIPNLSYFSSKSLDELQDLSFKKEVEKASSNQKDSFYEFKQQIEKIWPEEMVTKVSMENFQWAQSVVDSRGLRFKGKIYLAPFADMFNYAPHPQVRKSNSGEFFLKHHRLSEEDQALYILADRKTSKGEQLMEDYGDNADKIYLQYHGFAIDDNPFRCVTVYAPHAKGMRQQQIIDNIGLGTGDSGRFSHCMDSSGESSLPFLVYMTIIGFTEEQTDICYEATKTQLSFPELAERCGFDQVVKEFRMALKQYGSSSTTKISVQTSNVIFLIKKQIEELASSEKTTIEADEKVLASMERASDKASEQKRIAVRYRLNLKKSRRNLEERYISLSRLPIQHEMAEEASQSNDADNNDPDDNKENGVRETDFDEELQAGEMNISSSEEGVTLQEQLDRFNRWFQSTNPSINHLKASFLPGWRIGTITTTDVKQEDVYLGVPKSIIMDSTMAKADSHGVGELIAGLTAKYGPNSRDDFHELLFLLVNEYVRLGDTSFFWPYLSLLPTPADQGIVPTTWTSDEIATRLKPSHLKDSLMEYQARNRRTYDSIVKIDIIKEFFKEDLSWERYRWAQAILDSRSIWWAGVRHLVPMLDFINCIQGPEGSKIHSTAMDPSDQYAITRSSWDFKANEQLFENYGQSNHIYFMYHGFALPIAENKNDCVLHKFQLSEEEVRRIDFESDQIAQSVAQQIGLSREYSVTLCLTLPISKEAWLFYSLAKNNFISLKKKKKLGKSTAASRKMLLHDMENRLRQYDAHQTRHKGAQHFLNTERHQIAQIRDALSSSEKEEL